MKTHFLLTGFLALMVAVPTFAQDTNRAAREASLNMSRYDAVIAKLESQNDRLMQDIRTLQRQQDRLAKAAEDAQRQFKEAQDMLTDFRNTEFPNLKASQWGEGTRDCAGLGVKHQQIKVTMKPDGMESVRFLCFDGKPLLLGSERYMVGN